MITKNSAPSSKLNVEELISEAKTYRYLDPARAQCAAKQAREIARVSENWVGYVKAVAESTVHEAVDYESAITQRTEALRTVEQKGDEEAIVTAETLLGMRHKTGGRFPKALECFESALSKADKYPNQRAIALHESGDCLAWMGSFDEGIERLKSSIELYKELGDYIFQAHVTSCLGYAMYQAGLSMQDPQLTEKSYEHLIRAYEMMEGHREDGVAFSITAYNYAMYLADHKEFAKSASILKDIIEVHESRGETRLAIMNGITRAVHLSRLGQFEEAERLLTRATDSEQANGSVKMLPWIYHVWAEYYFWQGDLKLAAEFQLKCIDIDLQTERTSDVVTAYADLAEIYEAAKDYEGAFKALTQMNDARKKVEAANSKARIVKLNAESRIEQERLIAEVRKRDASILEQQISHQQQLLAATLSQLLDRTIAYDELRTELQTIIQSAKSPNHALELVSRRMRAAPRILSDWTKFESQFLEVYPKFRQSLIARFPSLTQQEIRVCQLLRVGMKSHEVGKLICVSERGVENHRFNIRKKLGLKTEDSLTKFLSDLK